MSGMTTDQFSKIMQTLKRKMGEANWTPPKSFVPYLKMYEKMIKGDYEARPKLEALLNTLLKKGKIPEGESFVFIDTLELQIGACNVDAVALIDAPGLMFKDSRWFAATPMTLLVVELDLDMKIDFFVKYFFKVPEAADALIEISKMNGVTIIQDDLDLLRSFEYMAEDDNKITLGWRFEEDMDAGQIIEIRGKLFNTFKKVFHEIKYGLGL